MPSFTATRIPRCVFVTSRILSALGANSPPSRGLCRLNLRATQPSLPSPSAADQETFDAHMKEMASKRQTPPIEAEEMTSDAALIALKKQARLAAEEQRGFHDGMLGIPADTDPSLQAHNIQ